jgi:hypothetical protein
MRKMRVMIALALVAVMVIPFVTMNAVAPQREIEDPVGVAAPSQVSDMAMVGAIEGIATQIDPWGTVRNAVGSFQNASYYSYAHTDAYQTAVEGQTATDNGYVSMAQLELSAKTTYPTGRMGGIAAALTIMVNPIVNMPEVYSNTEVLQPDAAEAITLAEEIVALYETALGLEFHRLAIMNQSMYVYFNYMEFSLNKYAGMYMIQYVSFPDDAAGNAALTSMKTRLSSLGGFMDLLGGADWPLEYSHFAETLLTHHIREGYYFGSNPFMMYGSIYQPFVRAHPTFADRVEKVETGVIGVAGFDAQDHITDVVGNEVYSLKQHVGYTGDIESKMFQVNTINSISSILGVTPTSLDISGVSTDWDYADKDFDFNQTSPLYILPDVVLPGDATVDEIIQAFMVHYPRYFADQLNFSIGMGVNPHMFDMYIDQLWGGMMSEFPDMREYFLEMDWSMAFAYYPYFELNQDTLRMVADRAGINPDVILDNVNDTIFDENPMQALFEACLETLDTYHLLDILVNTTYSNPYTLEGFLNDYIADIETFLTDVLGVDLPSSYETKEAFAALVEDHFGIILQGLWDAMAAFVGDTTGIKTAVQAMIDPIHLIEETVPYFIADVYSSLAMEYDYGLYVNFDLPVYTGLPEPYDPDLLWLTTDDILLEFDLDITGISYNNPHCIIEKVVPAEMAVGTNVTVSILVTNIGSATAFDLKVLDGISAGFNADKNYYWNRGTLAAGDTWTITFDIMPEEVGTYAEIPAILCYFNTSLNSFPPMGHDTWAGSAFYTFSQIGGEINVVSGAWWEGTVLGIPIIVVLGAGVGAIVIIVVVVMVKKRP